MPFDLHGTLETDSELPTAHRPQACAYGDQELLVVIPRAQLWRMRDISNIEQQNG